MGKYGPRSRNWENFSIVLSVLGNIFQGLVCLCGVGGYHIPRGVGWLREKGRRERRGRKGSTGNEFVVVVWPHM